MKLLKKLTLIGLFAAVVALMPTRAYADLFLNLNDGTNAQWQLQVQTGCVTCTEILSVTIPAGSSYIGNFLADFQWTIDGTTPVVAAGNPNMTSTNAGTTGDWALSEANISGNGCSGGDPHAVCGDWLPAGANTGFSIPAATTLNWHFTTTFTSNIGTPTAGNIRAFVIDSNAKNVSLFSPGGGDFTGGTGGSGDGGGGGGTGSTIPEPASLLLFGLGATALASRARRRLSAR
jgi:hypothetical protein